MKIVLPHNSTPEKTIARVDHYADTLFEGVGGEFVDLIDRKKSWTGSRMDFSLTADAGFISLPIAGTVTVDDANVTVECELPSAVKTFVGEDKIQATVENRVRALLGA